MKTREKHGATAAEITTFGSWSQCRWSNNSFLTLLLLVFYFFLRLLNCAVAVAIPSWFFRTAALISLNTRRDYLNYGPSKSYRQRRVKVSCWLDVLMILAATQWIAFFGYLFRWNTFKHRLRVCLCVADVHRNYSVTLKCFTIGQTVGNDFNEEKIGNFLRYLLFI